VRGIREDGLEILDLPQHHAQSPPGGRGNRALRSATAAETLPSPHHTERCFEFEEDRPCPGPPGGRSATSCAAFPGRDTTDTGRGVRDGNLQHLAKPNGALWDEDPPGIKEEEMPGKDGTIPIDDKRTQRQGTGGAEASHQGGGSFAVCGR